MMMERDRTMKNRKGSGSRDRKFLHSQILKALESMPKRLKEVFVLTHYEALSEDAVARKIGIERPEVELLIYDANSSFQRALRSSQLR